MRKSLPVDLLIHTLMMRSRVWGVTAVTVLGVLFLWFRWRVLQLGLVCLKRSQVSGMVLVEMYTQVQPMYFGKFTGGTFVLT